MRHFTRPNLVAQRGKTMILGEKNLLIFNNKLKIWKTHYYVEQVCVETVGFFGIFFQSKYVLMLTIQEMK